MKLFVLDGGRAHLPDMNHLTPDRNVGKPITIPIVMFLIDHPKGLVVFDTGVDTDDKDDPFLDAEPGQRIDRQIERLGYKTSDVKYVVVSHLHIDHIGGMAFFPDATFIVRRQELRAAWWPDASERGYDFERLLPTRGLRYLQPSEGETVDVFQDGSLLCVDTKGHTEGHQSLVVRLPGSGTVVLAGDAVQVAENLDAVVPPGPCWSNRWAVQQIEMLQHMRAEGALVILGHELAQLDALRLAPAYYD